MFSHINQAKTQDFFRILNFPNSQSNSNEELITKINSIDLIGKKRKKSNLFDNEDVNNGIPCLNQNSLLNKPNNAASGHENIIWINKNFKFENLKNSEVNTENPKNFLTNYKNSKHLLKKSSLINFVGESKITDFFKEKKKNINIINKQFEKLNFCQEDLLEAKNEKAFTKPEPFIKKEITKEKIDRDYGINQSELKEDFNQVLENKLHNKFIIQLNYLNKNTIMEDFNSNEEVIVSPKKNDLINKDETLHDKLIFTGKINFLKNNNNFNFQKIKNNCKNNTNISLKNKSDHSALNYSIGNNRINSRESFNLGNNLNLNSSEKETLDIGYKKVLRQNKFPFENTNNNNNNNNFEFIFNENSFSNNKNYNNFSNKRENICNNEIASCHELNDENEKMRKNHTLNIFGNSLTNLILNEKENESTPFLNQINCKQTELHELENSDISKYEIFKRDRNLIENSFKLKDCNESLYNNESKHYEIFNKQTYHTYFSSKNNKNCNLNIKMMKQENQDIHRKKMRLSLSKKKVKINKNYKEKSKLNKCSKNTTLKIINNRLINDIFKPKNDSNNLIRDSIPNRKNSQCYEEALMIKKNNLKGSLDNNHYSITGLPLIINSNLNSNKKGKGENMSIDLIDGINLLNSLRLIKFI